MVISCGVKWAGEFFEYGAVSADTHIKPHIYSLVVQRCIIRFYFPCEGAPPSRSMPFLVMISSFCLETENNSEAES